MNTMKPWTPIAALLTLTLAACSDSDGTAPDDEMGASGMTGGPMPTATAGTGGTQGIPGTGGDTSLPPPGGGTATDALIPDPTGWIDATTNDLGIQGPWYSYNDCKDSPGACTMNQVPAEGEFPNTGGSMCTSGTTAVVAAEAEFSAKWGAGIALDLNNSGGTTGVKQPYDAASHGVVGFSFTITGTAPGLRVNFPTPASAEGSHFIAGKPGANSALFATAKQGSWVMPKSDIDPSQVLSIQFQIPSVMGSAVEFDFCVENLAPLTQ
jgi:hypothetical protein